MVNGLFKQIASRHHVMYRIRHVMFVSFNPKRLRETMIHDRYSENVCIFQSPVMFVTRT